MTDSSSHPADEVLIRALDRVIPAGARLQLDTSVLLAHIAGTEGISWASTRIVDEYLANGRNDAVIAAVTIGEMLVRPMRAGGRAPGVMVEMVWSIENLSVKTTDDLVAIEAARIRAATGVRMSDAMVLATVALTSCTILVTNDKVMAQAAGRALPELRVVVLSEVAAV